MGIPISGMTPVEDGLLQDADQFEINRPGTGTRRVTGQMIKDSVGSGNVKGALWDGTGSLSVLGSSGIAAVAKLSTGLYKVTFSTPMSSPNYRVSTAARRILGSNFGNAHIGPGDDRIQLLANFNGSNGATSVSDSSLYNHVLTLSGTAALDTSVKKYGSASLAFGAGGTCRSDSIMDFTSNDFTVELFWRASNLAGEPIVIGSDVSGFTSGYTAWLLFVGASGQLIFFASSTGSNWNIAGPATSTNGTISVDTWYHIAIVRSGSTIKIYVDGVLAITVNSAGTLQNTSYLRMGEWAAANVFTGNIDDLRVSNYAVYANDFTPPASEFTVDSGMAANHCYIETSVNNVRSDLPLISAIFSE